MDIPKYLTEKELVKYIKERVPFSERVKSAISQAKKSHENQTREDGQPYLNEHIYPVTKLAIDYFDKNLTEELISSVILHDVLEDDAEMTDSIFKEKFGDGIFSTVKQLSKPIVDGDTETERREKANKAYFENLRKASHNAKIIKLLDRIDNLFWAMTFGEELVKIYIKETKEFYLGLAHETDQLIYIEIKKLLHALEQKAKQAGFV